MDRPLTLLLLVWFVPAVSAATPEFEKDVLPILTAQCVNCHGGLQQRGELDLRTVASIARGGTSGPAVVTGNLEKSVLWQKVSRDEMSERLDVPGDRFGDSRRSVKELLG